MHGHPLNPASPHRMKDMHSTHMEELAEQHKLREKMVQMLFFVSPTISKATVSVLHWSSNTLAVPLGRVGRGVSPPLPPPHRSIKTKKKINHHMSYEAMLEKARRFSKSARTDEDRDRILQILDIMLDMIGARGTTTKTEVPVTREGAAATTTTTTNAMKHSANNINRNTNSNNNSNNSAKHNNGSNNNDNNNHRNNNNNNSNNNNNNYRNNSDTSKQHKGTVHLQNGTWTDVVRRRKGPFATPAPLWMVQPKQFGAAIVSDAAELDVQPAGTFLATNKKSAQEAWERVKRRCDRKESIACAVLCETKFCADAVTTLVQGKADAETGYTRRQFFVCRTPTWTWAPEVCRETSVNNQTSTTIVALILSKAHVVHADVWTRAVANPTAELGSLVTTRCKQAGFSPGPRDVWKVRTNDYQLSIQLRVKNERLAPLLRLSGHEGLFMTAVSHVPYQPDLYAVVWLDRALTMDHAWEFCNSHEETTLGLVIGSGGGLGIRLTNNYATAEAVNDIGVNNVTPLMDPRAMKYTVLGARQYELREDIVKTLQASGFDCKCVSSYKKKRQHVIIVCAQERPQFTKIARGDYHEPLLIRETVPEDRPTRKMRQFKGAIHIPNAQDGKSHDYSRPQFTGAASSPKRD